MEKTSNTNDAGAAVAIGACLYGFENTGRIQWSLIPNTLRSASCSSYVVCSPFSHFPPKWSTANIELYFHLIRGKKKKQLCVRSILTGNLKCSWCKYYKWRTDSHDFYGFREICGVWENTVPCQSLSLPLEFNAGQAPFGVNLTPLGSGDPLGQLLLAAPEMSYPIGFCNARIFL